MGIVGKASDTVSGISINEMSHGFDSNGIQNYLEEIKAIVLTEAEEAIKDISGIQKAVKENWNGQAAYDFIAQLSKSAEHVAGQYEQLYEILIREISEIGRKMSGFDKNLIGGE